MPKVLHVDDDAPMRAMVARVLRAHGHEVEQAKDGSAALARLARDPLPDVILLDADLPGLDGVGFRAIQVRDPRLARLPVVLLAGSGEELCGGSCVVSLSMPFDGSRLEAAIASALAEPCDCTSAALGRLCLGCLVPRRLVRATGSARRADPQRVLVVEDDAASVAMLVELLRGEGYAPTPVTTAPAALEAIRTGTYAALLLDLTLPGMPSDRFVEEVAAILRRPPVVVFSARPPSELEKVGRSLNATAVLAKPGGLDELLAALRVAASSSARAASI